MWANMQVSGGGGGQGAQSGSLNVDRQVKQVSSLNVGGCVRPR